MKYLKIFFLVFIFISTFIQAETDFNPTIDPAVSKKHLLDQIEYLNASDRLGVWKIEFNEVESLPDGSLSKIYPKLEPGEPFKVVVNMTSEGMKNPLLVIEDMMHLNQIFGNVEYGEPISRTYISPLQWGETVSNAALGSASAQKKLAAMKLDAALKMKTIFAEKIYPSTSDLDPKALDDYVGKRISLAQQKYDEALKAEKAFLREAQKKWDVQREKFPALEAQSEKLNDLIAKNDRKGVRNLLEDYLPWPLMEPSEAKTWRDWLEAIEHPERGEKRLLFRGLDEDSIPLSPEGKPYQMSTVLTKNQGNYNRRLRSLTTMRDKFGMDHLENEFTSEIPKYKGDKSLTLMMRNHADNPYGSPFLSAAQPNIALRFGKKKRAAILVNENRLIRNINSQYLTEKETLLPLIIFPDEIVHYVDNTASNQLIDNKRFIAEVEAKLGRSLLIEELDSNAVTKAEFVKMGLQDLNTHILDLPSPSTVSCVVGTGAGCDCALKALGQLLK